MLCPCAGESLPKAASLHAAPSGRLPASGAQASFLSMRARTLQRSWRPSTPRAQLPSAGGQRPPLPAPAQLAPESYYLEGGRVESAPLTLNPCLLGSRTSFHHPQSAPFLFSASSPSCPPPAPLHQPFASPLNKELHRLSFLVLNLSLIGIRIF